MFRTIARNILFPRNFMAAIQTILIMSLILGTVPIGLLGSKDSIYLSYLGVLIRVCILIYIFIHSVVFNETFLTRFFPPHISRLVDIMQKSNHMFAVLVAFWMTLLRRKQLKKIIISLKTIEDRLQEMGIIFKQHKFALFINLKLSLAVGLNLFLVIMSASGWELQNGSWQSVSTYLACFAPNWVLCSVVLTSSCLNYKIFLSFKANNKVLKNLSNQWENRKIRSISGKSRSLNCLESFSMYTIVTKNPCEIIHESMEIHHLICEAASTANKYFTYQLLTIISIAFLIIVFDAYYVLETLLGKSKRESKFKTVEFVTFFSCQMILYLIAIISIVEGSNRAIKKSQKTGGIIHSLLNKAKNPDVKEKLQQFSMQLVHLKIKFTAAGLFNIDRTLYFTISGALTTYLIILLQFTSSTPDSRGPCIFKPNFTTHGDGN